MVIYARTSGNLAAINRVQVKAEERVGRCQPKWAEIRRSLAKARPRNDGGFCPRFGSFCQTHKRPVYCYPLSLSISLNTGLDLAKALIQIPIFLLLGLGYGSRAVVTPFLSLVILLTAANLGYQAIRSGEEPAERASRTAIPQSLKLVRRPSVYILAEGLQTLRSCVEQLQTDDPFSHVIPQYK